MVGGGGGGGVMSVLHIKSSNLDQTSWSKEPSQIYRHPSQFKMKPPQMYGLCMALHQKLPPFCSLGPFSSYYVL